MTKILIVEDDAAQARQLAKAISVRRPNYTVFTAPNGAAATALLRDREADVVLTDLQMPEMNGFELIAWLLEHRPTVAVFIMTAYGNALTEQQLSAYGPVACFTKPVDVEKVLERIGDSLSHDVRGHVKNMSLPPFLQLLELERMSCTLNVEHEGRRGTLFVQKGELLDARVGELSGEPAALEVIAWNCAAITISANAPGVTRAIEKPIGFLIMDALRIQDESARAKYIARSSLPPRKLEAAAFPLPTNALGVSLIDTRTGLVLAHGERPGVPLSELSDMALTILTQEERVLSSGEGDELIEEVVITGHDSCELIRRVPGHESLIVLMVFKTEETNLVIARLELERLLRDTAWHALSPAAV
ncbi:MAG TPA: response regulator [Polyangiaceae bacterium]|nr:response regulator [Polyangiaceae bacterium]